MENRYHYRLIARAIAAIDAAPGPLTLDALAGQLRVSPAHFQRVFSQWAGVSPKRYQQYLTLHHAKTMLAAELPLLQVAGAAGLSGPSRLHDLFVTWEAMTPGTWAARGHGLTIGEAAGDSPYGPFWAMITDRGLCGLGFALETGLEATRADLRARWPEARFAPDPAATEAALAAMRGAGRLHVMGGPFQIKVWEALLHLAEGRATSYGTLARHIGQPGAARAVGTAVGRNPLAGVIPCHRVLRRSGALGGYHWGLPVKRLMLAREAARAGAGGAGEDRRETAKTSSAIA